MGQKATDLHSSYQAHPSCQIYLLIMTFVFYIYIYTRNAFLSSARQGVIDQDVKDDRHSCNINVRLPHFAVCQ